MLFCKYLPGTRIIEMTDVKKKAAKTVTTFWYFDTSTWLKSSLGEKNERPMEVMSQEQIDWVNRICVPLAQQHSPDLEQELCTA